MGCMRFPTKTTIFGADILDDETTNIIKNSIIKNKLFDTAYIYNGRSETVSESHNKIYEKKHHNKITCMESKNLHFDIIMYEQLRLKTDYIDFTFHALNKHLWEKVVNRFAK